MILHYLNKDNIFIGNGLYLIVCLLISSLSYGQVYKCQEENKVTYSQHPCPEDTRATVFKKANPKIKVSANRDIKRFDIAGVRLGMNEDDAINAIITYLEVAKQDLQVYYNNDDKNILNRNKKIYMLDHMSGRYSVILFTDLDNIHNTQKVVYGVVHQIPQWKNIDQYRSIREKVIQKYGYYTYQQPSGLLQWCNSSPQKEKKRCEIGKEDLLQLHSTMLTITKETYSNVIRDHHLAFSKYKSSY